MKGLKHLQLDDISFKAVGQEGEFEGYGSVFGVVDSYGEVVDKGAFTESLAKFGMPKLLLQHYSNSVAGIYLECREDEKGLYVKGQLNLEVQAARETYALLKQGALNGLSIGFRTLEETINKETGAVHLVRVRLYEVSIVTFPANEAATISGVKAEAPDTIRGFEGILREAGYSSEDAKYIAVNGFKAFEARREGGDYSALMDSLERLNQQLRKSLPHASGGYSGARQ